MKNKTYICKGCGEKLDIKTMSSIENNININIYCDYQVVFEVDYSYLNEYGDFSDGRDNWSRKMNGFDLIKFLSNILSAKDIHSFYVKDKKMYIDKFDPRSGECSNIRILYKELEEEKEKQNE